VRSSHAGSPGDDNQEDKEEAKTYDGRHSHLIRETCVREDSRDNIAGIAWCSGYICRIRFGVGCLG
jgi:hypothetical protein